MLRMLVSCLLVLGAACSGTSPADNDPPPSRPVPCVEGAACTCGNLGQGTQTCRGKAAGACACADGSETALQSGDAGATTGDSAVVEAPEGDTCEETSLARMGTREVTRGTEAIFTAELEGRSDTFRSSCVRAEGPDVIQPLRARTRGTLVLVVESTAGFVGTPVLYLKATCNGARDLACDALAGRLRAPVDADTTYFLHVDSVARAHAEGAHVTIRATIE